MKISFAKPEDAESIARIFHKTGQLHQERVPDIFLPSSFENDLKYVRENIGREEVKIFKAESDGVICGYLVLYLNEYPSEFFRISRYGFVGSIGVETNYRRCGIGTALMRAAEEYLKTSGVRAIEIDVFTFNTEAERLYAALGYEDIKHYKRKVL